MTCIPAPSCRVALNEATSLYPNRSKLSDGVCASAQHHQDNPNSDHETGDAFDLTHDPANGCDVDALFTGLVARRDPRVKYLIRNRRICRSYDKYENGHGIPAWTWAPYSGSNPHVKHGHCSILPGARDNTDPWFTTTSPEEPDMTGPQADQLTRVDNRVANLEGAMGGVIDALARIEAALANGAGGVTAEQVADELAQRLDG